MHCGISDVISFGMAGLYPQQ